MAGLTPEGFDPETFETLRAKIVQRMRNEFGPIPLDSTTLLGQAIDIIVEALVKLWEAAEACHASFDIDKALDAALDALCLLTGTRRNPPTYSTGLTLLTGVPATEIPKGQQVSTGANGVVVKTSAKTILVATTAWDTSINYLVGAIVTNDGNVYYCHADANNTIDPPTHTQRSGFAILPGTPPQFWTWVGEGVAHVEVDAQAIVKGPQVVASFALVDIEVPLLGLDGVGNILDFDTGQNVETSEALKVRREIELTRRGSTPKDAIRSDLFDVVNVTQVTVFMNTTDTTNADGVPPHAVEALVRGGDDQKIFDTLLQRVAAGIGTHGNTTGSSTDSQGTVETVKFSRPVEKAVYIAATVSVDAARFPADGADQIEAAIIAYGDDVDAGGKCGVDVRARALIAAVGAARIPGLLDIPSMFIGLAPAPATEVTIAIALRELATYDTSRIGVTVNPVTP